MKHVYILFTIQSTTPGYKEDRIESKLTKASSQEPYIYIYIYPQNQVSILSK